MKKKELLKIVGSVLVLMLLIAGACTPSQQTEIPLDGEEPSVKETINIKFSTWHPPASKEVVTVWEPMLEELKKRSNGQITYTPYYGAALGAGPEHYDIVAGGLSDMGYFTATWTPGRFPLSDVLSMPIYVGGKDQATDLGNAMYERILNREFPDVKVLELNGCAQSYIWTNKPVRSLEDLKGLRLRTPGGLQTYLIQALGAEPAFMPLGDVYLSLETGVIDGLVVCPPLFQAYRFYELAKNMTVFSLGCVTEGIIMNADSWKKIPEDLKPIIEEVVRNPFHTTNGLNEEVINDIMEDIANQGVEFYQLPPEEEQRWIALFTENVIKKWVEDMESQGLPGKETILIYKAELDKRGIPFPAFPPEWEEEVKE